MNYGNFISIELKAITFTDVSTYNYVEYLKYYLHTNNSLEWDFIVGNAIIEPIIMHCFLLTT